MATTTNFGWDTPDDTDLVKDGALAIRTLGSSIDTSFVDLKGGTTGQVLSKASNTDLDYTWVTTDDANAIQNAIVDAKGDLISATAADTPARLAVGNNGETLVADSAASTGLRWQASQAAGKNYAINGAFDVWQRGTSYNLTTTVAYGFADRWAANQDSTAAGVASQVTTSLPEGFRYALKLQRNSSGTNVNPIRTYQILETQNSIPLQGKVVTLSFWAKAGANYSSASSALSVRVATGTGTDQSVTTLPSGGLTGYAEVVSTTVTLTTSWQRFSLTSSAISSSATQAAFGFFFTPSGTAGADDSFQITGVQLEIGSVATSFTRTGGTLQGELAACQRYYQLLASGNGKALGMANSYATTAFDAFIHLPVEMRTTPTLSVVSGTNYYQIYTTLATTFNDFSLGGNTTARVVGLNKTGLSGLTAGQSGLVTTNNASSSVAVSAEL